VGAARRLGVDHTTVARRIQALEKQVGAALFAREAGGHRLSEAGRQLLPQVEAMEAAFLAVENATPGVRQGLQGLVRIGCTEGFGNLVLAPQLAHFAQAHPGLVVDLLSLPRLVHLSRREADIVISLERPSRGAVLVVKLTDYRLQLYGARSYLAQHAPITRTEDLQGHHFISYVDDLLFSKELQSSTSCTARATTRCAAPASSRSTKPRARAPAWPCCPPSSPRRTRTCAPCCPMRRASRAPSGCPCPPKTNTSRACRRCGTSCARRCRRGRGCYCLRSGLRRLYGR